MWSDDYSGRFRGFDDWRQPFECLAFCFHADMAVVFHHLPRDVSSDAQYCGLWRTAFEQLLKGMKVGDKTFKVHLDGYNITDALAGKAPNPRHEFLYFNDDGSLVALRYNQWKIVFQEQRAHGFDVWQEPFTPLRLPKIFNLRSDPFELADHDSIDYAHWRIDRTFLLVPAQQYIGQFLATFKEFPPSQKVGTFSLDQVLESLQRSGDR